MTVADEVLSFEIKKELTIAGIYPRGPTSCVAFSYTLHPSLLVFSCTRGCYHYHYYSPGKKVMFVLQGTLSHSGNSDARGATEEGVLFRSE